MQLKFFIAIFFLNFLVIRPVSYATITEYEAVYVQTMPKQFIDLSVKDKIIYGVSDVYQLYKYNVSLNQWDLFPVPQLNSMDINVLSVATNNTGTIVWICGDNDNYVYKYESSTWTQIIIPFKCSFIRVGYGPNAIVYAGQVHQTIQASIYYFTAPNAWTAVTSIQNNYTFDSDDQASTCNSSSQVFLGSSTFFRIMSSNDNVVFYTYNGSFYMIRPSPECTDGNCLLNLNIDVGNIESSGKSKYGLPWFTNSTNQFYKIQCRSPNYFQEITQKCVVTCPNYLITKTFPSKICETCSKYANSYFLAGECVSATSCADINAIAGTNTSAMECKCNTTGTITSFVSASIGGFTPLPWPTKSKCVSTCDMYGLTLNNNGFYGQGICERCPNNYDIETKSCVTTCSSAAASNFNNPTNKTCIDCKVISKRYLHDFCITQDCPGSNMVQGPNYAAKSECRCDSGFYFYNPYVTSKSSTAGPSTPSCVSSCATYFLSFITNDRGLNNNRCESCENINPSLPYFDFPSSSCVAAPANCSANTTVDAVNLVCKPTSCKLLGKLGLHDLCQTGTNCLSDLNASEAPSYATDNKCICTGKKYFPSGITAYSPITKPANPICVTNCSAYYLSFITNDQGLGNDKCASCASINAALDYFDPATNTCVASSNCSAGRYPQPTNKFCTNNCKDISKLKLHGQCLTGTNCLSDLNAAETASYATDNSCICTGKKYFPSGITAYSPITKPANPICVTNCTDYYLSYITNDQGLGNDKCASCASINAALDYFDPATNTCVASTGCSAGRYPHTTEKYCTNICKDAGMLKLHGLCISASPFQCTTLNAIQIGTFATDNGCICGGTKYFPSGVVAFSPISKPSSPECVTNCSSYYLSFIINDQGLGNDKCASCESINPAQDYFNPSTNTCVASANCSVGYIPIAKYKVCVNNCKIVNFLTFKGACLELPSCPSLNAINGPNFVTNNECVCGSLKYFPTGITAYTPIVKPTNPICVNNCSDYYLSSDINNVCASCESLDPSKPYYDPVSKQCYPASSCKTADPIRKICTQSCKDAGKIELHGECWTGTQCSDLNASPTSTFSTQSTCQCIGNKFFPNGITTYSPISKPSTPQCVQNCAYYYLTFITNDSGLGNDKCLSCASKDVNTPFFNVGLNNCISSCEIGAITDNTNKFCINCKNLGKFYVNGSCSSGSSCLSFNMISGNSYSTTNECISCTSANSSRPYLDLDSGSCITQCLPNSESSSVDKTCKNCTKHKKVLNTVNGLCETCPSNKYYYEYFENPSSVITAKCVDIVIDNLFIENGKVVPTCSAGLFGDTNHICQVCYNYKESCVLECPINYFKQSDNSCKSCKDLGTYLYKNTCVSHCPYYIDLIATAPDTENICYTCLELNKISSDSGCVDTCPQSWYIDTGVNKCINCKKNGMVFLEYACALKCPPNMEVNLKTNACVQITNKICNSDSCNNNGVCSITDNKINCKCNDNFIGSYCEYNKPQLKKSIFDAIQILNSTYSHFNYNTTYAIDHLKMAMKLDNSIVNTEFNNFLLNVSEEISKIIQTQPLKKDMFEVYDAGIISFRISNDIDTTKNSTEEIKTLRNYTQALTSKLVQLDQINNEIIKGNENFAIQIAETSKPLFVNKESIENFLSIIDMKECVNVLRNFYNISNDIPLKYSKIDFVGDEKVSNTTTGTSVLVEFYNPRTNEKLNKSICDSTTTQINLPLASIAKEINSIKEVLKEYKIQGNSNSKMDITNKSDPIYTDRCILFKNENGSALTLNERRNLFYPNSTISCVSTNEEPCEFGGIDENFYAVCKCKGVQETKNIFVDAFIDSISDINIDIVICYAQVYKLPSVLGNMGLYVVALYLTLLVSTLFIMNNTRNKIIENHTKEVIHNDCFFMNEEESEWYSKMEKRMKEEIDKHAEQNIEVIDKSNLILVKEDKENDKNDKENVKVKADSVIPKSKPNSNEESLNILPDNKLSKDVTIKQDKKDITNIEKLENIDLNPKNNSNEELIKANTKTDFFYKKKKFQKIWKIGTRRKEKKENTISKREGKNFQEWLHNFHLHYIQSSKEKQNSDENKDNILKINDQPFKLRKLHIQLSNQTFYNDPTKQDFKKGLKLEQKLELDNRSNLQYFWDNATDSCYLLSLIFNKSLVNPFYITAFVFYNKILLETTLNAIFYDDKLIQESHYQEAKKSNILFAFTKLTGKIIISSVSSTILTLMFTIPLRVPDAIRKKFNLYLRKATIPDIKNG